jgi:hypothetical protein
MAQTTIVDTARIRILPTISIQDINKFVRDFERLFAQKFGNSSVADPLTDQFQDAGRDSGRGFSTALGNSIDTQAAVSEVSDLKDRAETILKSIADGTIDIDSQQAITELSQIQSRADELVRSINNGSNIELNSQQALTELDQIQSRLNALNGSINIPPINVPVQMPNGTQLGNQLGQQIQNGVSGTTAQTGTTAGNTLGSTLLSAFTAVLAGGAIGAAISEAMDIEEGNNKLQAQLALTAEQSKAYGKIAGELYTGAYGESMDDVNATLASVLGSFDQIEGRMASYDEIKKMTQDVLNLSSTYGLAQEQITGAVQSFTENGLGTWDEGVQLIVDGYTNMGTKGDDWIDTIREYSGDFKTMGLDAESAFNVINGLLEAGVFNTDTAADSLREFGILARTMDQGQVDALTAIGLDPETIQRKAIEGGDSLVEAYVDVQKRLQENKDQNLYTALIGGQSEDQFNAFVNADWSNMTGNSEKTANNIDLINKNMGQGTTAALTGLQRQFQVTLGEIAVPLMQILLPLLQGMASFLTQNKDLLLIIGPPLLILVTIIGAVLAGMAAWSVISVVFNSAMLGVIASTWAWTVALLANPVTWIVLAVIALIAALVLLVMNWDTVVKFLGDTWAAFVDGVVALWNWFGEYFSNLGQDIAFLWGYLMIALSDGWNDFIGFFSDGFSAIGERIVGLGQGIADFFVGIWDFVMSIVDNIVSLFSGDWLGGIMGGSFNIGFGNFGIPGMANGGTVPATPGGSLRILGEAGRSEIVADEGKHNKNLDNQNKLIEYVIENGSTNNKKDIRIIVEDHSGLDEREVAAIVKRQLMWEDGV